MIVLGIILAVIGIFVLLGCLGTKISIFDASGLVAVIAGLVFVILSVIVFIIRFAFM